MMSAFYTVDGLEVEIHQAGLGQGGQGEVYGCAPTGNPVTRLALKRMPNHGQAWERTKHLVNRQVCGLSPALAGPVCADIDANGDILHIALLAEGVSWEEDVGRNFPECLEMALQLVCLLVLLEEHGMAHGDLDINNMRIAPDGTISLIDFDGFISEDPDVPDPTTTGHRRMQAPELRNQSGVIPTKESDRYALSVLLSMLLLGRFPTDGLPDEPAEVDRFMTQGHWPEHDRIPAVDELRFEALGARLIDLFDRGFSLDPTARPSPDEWRLALTDALDNCWSHDCGCAFVADAGETTCPGCGHPVTVPGGKSVLKIELAATGARYSVELADRQPVIVGRQTIPNLPATVSGKHLQITAFGDRLHLHHLGRNQTLIQKDCAWYWLDRHWLHSDDVHKRPVELRLADVEITLTLV